MKKLIAREPERLLTVTKGRGAGRIVAACPNWEDDTDPLPSSVDVFTRDEPYELLLGRAEGPFRSIQHTKELALEIASKWYNGGRTYKS